MLRPLSLPFLSRLPTSKQFSDFSGYRKHTRTIHTHPLWDNLSTLYVFEHQFVAGGAENRGSITFYILQCLVAKPTFRQPTALVGCPYAVDLKCSAQHSRLQSLGNKKKKKINLSSRFLLNQQASSKEQAVKTKSKE